MDKPWLSIILPSIREEQKLRFIDSLERTSSKGLDVAIDGIELVIDSDPAECVIEAVTRCVKRAKADWLWFANDDLVSQTEGWDVIFKQCTEHFTDKVAMFYPNDGLFGYRFPCFPLVAKECIRELFPSPYLRYKVDDSIRDIIPAERRHYMGNVLMSHSNFSTNQSDFGFNLGDGRVYLQDQKSMAHDHNIFIGHKQVELRKKLLAQNEEKMRCFQMA
jgi:hypothetical protein